MYSKWVANDIGLMLKVEFFYLNVSNREEKVTIHFLANTLLMVIASLVRINQVRINQISLFNGNFLNFKNRVPDLGAKEPFSLTASIIPSLVKKSQVKKSQGGYSPLTYLTHIPPPPIEGGQGFQDEASPPKFCNPPIKGEGKG